MKKIYAIVVTFEPVISRFENCISTIKKNFDNILIVNNSPKLQLGNYKSPKVTIINNRKNIGLASGLNVGINEAKKRGADMVAIFDQDSSLDDNFSSKILNKINNLGDTNKIGLFSPIYFNKITYDYGSIINFKPLRLIRSIPDKDKNVLHPQYVITSGSFIPMTALDDIGLMRDELFIDFIDIEWCLRARKLGYEIVAFPNIEMTHYLGESSVSVMGNRYPIHSPLRMYYYFRNSIYLYQSADIDWNWTLIDASRNVLRFLFYVFFVKDRLKYIKYIFKGYYHGFIKKMGKLEE